MVIKNVELRTEGNFLKSFCHAAWGENRQETFCLALIYVSLNTRCNICRSDHGFVVFGSLEFNLVEPPLMIGSVWAEETVLRFSRFFNLRRKNIKPDAQNNNRIRIIAVTFKTAEFIMKRFTRNCSIPILA